MKHRHAKNGRDKPSRSKGIQPSAEGTRWDQRITLGPAARDPIPAVFVTNRVAQPLVYRKRVARVDGAKPGDLVAVYTQGDRLAGYGLFNPRSEIAIRMLWYNAELPTELQWHAKMDAAVSLRRQMLRLDDDTNAYRVVHAESDGLSGLVVDKLGDVLSAEAFSLGMYQRGSLILPDLARRCGTPHWLLRPSPSFVSQEGCEPPALTSAGCPTEVEVNEFGTRFRVRFAESHKTGFFCDQRDNRRRLASYCRGKSVLDLCCYTGGFAVQAKVLGGAEEVTGVDLDESPLKLARENANLNQARMRFVQADAFAYMREMQKNHRQFDVVVLDPPKLIRTRDEIDEGKRRHFALNRLAMRLVRPGGVLLTCSCAGLLSESDFLQLVIAAARQSGEPILTAENEENPVHAPRDFRILEKAGAAPDHPVASNCLETEYLKAFWLVMT